MICLLNVDVINAVGKNDPFIHFTCTSGPKEIPVARSLETETGRTGP